MASGKKRDLNRIQFCYKSEWTVVELVWPRVTFQVLLRL